MGRNVIVGGLGNLGRHMQRALLARGADVRVIDRVPTAAARGTAATEATVANRIVDRAVEFVPHRLGRRDARTTDDLRAALRGAETVYSMVTPDVQHGTVAEFRATNVDGVKGLLGVCREVGVPKFVYVSSIAVTDHLSPSIEQNEGEPLPDIEGYRSEYDITKRLGEEAVLEAGDHEFRTCALRLGGLLASPMDYSFRPIFSQPGKINTVSGLSRIDYSSAKDFCRALWKASEKLHDSDSELPGMALFVTKCRKGKAPAVDELARYAGELLGWPVSAIPQSVLSAVQFGTWLQHLLSDAFTGNSNDEGSQLGIPPHLFLELANHQQTFDNSLARRVLSYEPEETWEEAVEWIVDDYRKGVRI